MHVKTGYNLVILLMNKGVKNITCAIRTTTNVLRPPGLCTGLPG